MSRGTIANGIANEIRKGTGVLCVNALSPGFS